MMTTQNKPQGIEKEIKEVENMNCPVCGYYCLGTGGFFCIDKKGMWEKVTRVKETNLLN